MLQGGHDPSVEPPAPRAMPAHCPCRRKPHLAVGPPPAMTASQTIALRAPKRLSRCRAVLALPQAVRHGSRGAPHGLRLPRSTPSAHSLWCPAAVRVNGPPRWSRCPSTSGRRACPRRDPAQVRTDEAVADEAALRVVKPGRVRAGMLDRRLEAVDAKRTHEAGQHGARAGLVVDNEGLPTDAVSVSAAPMRAP